MFEIVLFVVCLRSVGINFENVYIKYIALNADGGGGDGGGMVIV